MKILCSIFCLLLFFISVMASAYLSSRNDWIGVGGLFCGVTLCVIFLVMFVYYIFYDAIKEEEKNEKSKESK